MLFGYLHNAIEGGGRWLILNRTPGVSAISPDCWVKRLQNSELFSTDLHYFVLPCSLKYAVHVDVDGEMTYIYASGLALKECEVFGDIEVKHQAAFEHFPRLLKGTKSRPRPRDYLDVNKLFGVSS